MKVSKLIAAAIFTMMVLLTFGCGGGKDNNQAAAPAPTPTTPVTPTTPTTPTTPVINGMNCPVVNSGGTALMGNPYSSKLSSMYNYGYASNDMVSLTLFTMGTTYGYGPQRVAGTIGLTISNMNQFQSQTQQTSICANASFSQQNTFNSSNGTVQAVFQGTTNYSSNPYYPAQQQQVWVYVGYECPAYLMPAYGSTGSTVQGCISVQIGNQQPFQMQATGTLY